MEQIATVILDSTNAILVLMLVSLGLAIIFGLMNVINMAHGEFLMLGCYAVMELTKIGLPFFLALALSPLVVAAIGLIAEELVIKRTYHRLIDTILATWGLALVLRQAMVLDLRSRLVCRFATGCRFDRTVWRALSGIPADRDGRQPGHDHRNVCILLRHQMGTCRAGRDRQPRYGRMPWHKHPPA